MYFQPNFCEHFPCEYGTAGSEILWLGFYKAGSTDTPLDSLMSCLINHPELFESKFQMKLTWDNHRGTGSRVGRSLHREGLLFGRWLRVGWVGFDIWFASVSPARTLGCLFLVVRSSSKLQRRLLLIWYLLKYKTHRLDGLRWILLRKRCSKAGAIWTLYIQLSFYEVTLVI